MFSRPQDKRKQAGSNTAKKAKRPPLIKRCQGAPANGQLQHSGKANCIGWFLCFCCSFFFWVFWDFYLSMLLLRLVFPGGPVFGGRLCHIQRSYCCSLNEILAKCAGADHFQASFDGIQCRLQTLSQVTFHRYQHPPWVFHFDQVFPLRASVCWKFFITRILFWRRLEVQPSFKRIYHGVGPLLKGSQYQGGGGLQLAQIWRVEILSDPGGLGD